MIRGAVALTALLCGPRLLPAQEASLFLGAAHARFADSLSGTSAFAALRLATGTRLRAARLEASYSRLTEGGWAAQADGQLTALWPVGGGGHVWAGLAAGGALSDYQGGRISGTAAAGPLAVGRLASSYLSFGLSGGAVRRVDSTAHGLVSGSVRWQWLPGGSLSLDVGLNGTAADTLRFADASTALRLSAPRARALLVLGLRAGDLADGPWGSVELAWSVAPAVSVEGAAGRYPRDLTGFAEGFFAQAGLRIYGHGTGRGTPARRAAALTVEPRPDGTVRVRVRLAPGLGDAAIAGDWNAWEPVPLRRAGDVWIADLRLEPGMYRYAIVVGGVWMLPEGMDGIADEFGGRVGVLVVTSR